MLGVSGLRSTPGPPPTAAKTVGTQQRRIASRKRPSNASDACIAPRLTNTPRVTSYGLDWPFTRKPREKKPAASSRRRSHLVVLMLGWARGGDPHSGSDGAAVAGGAGFSLAELPL